MPCREYRYESQGMVCAVITAFIHWRLFIKQFKLRNGNATCPYQAIAYSVLGHWMKSRFYLFDGQFVRIAICRLPFTVYVVMEHHIPCSSFCSAKLIRLFVQIYFYINQTLFIYIYAKYIKMGHIILIDDKTRHIHTDMA